MLHTVLVPSLGILLFNLITTVFQTENGKSFSSPLWGFFYLIKFDTSNVTDMRFSSPLWGFFYLIVGVTGFEPATPFSSPLWGFFYLIDTEFISPIYQGLFSSPLWGFFYLIEFNGLIKFEKDCSRPLSGDSFI